MSFASMPLYTGDYLRDTRHLTPQKHGVYFLLLMYCWDQKAPLPLDEQECAGIANCRSADEVESLRYVLNRFFVCLDDGWYNKRIAEEVAKAEALSAKNRENGLKSAAARREKVRDAVAKRRDEQAEAMVERSLNGRLTSAEGSSVSPTPTPTSSPTKSKTENPSVPFAGANEDVARLSGEKAERKEAAKRVLDFLNQKTGRKFRYADSTLKFITARLKDGATEAECRAVIVIQEREWRGTDMEKYLTPDTLFNAVKFEKYVAKVGTFSKEAA